MLHFTRLAGATLLAAALLLAADAPGGRVEGVVVDPDGKPVADAAVLMTGWSEIPEKIVKATTDREGRFALGPEEANAAVAGRNWMLLAYKPGWAVAGVRAAGSSAPSR